MADTTSYVLETKFASASGDFKMSYKYFNGEATDNQVKTFVNAVVTNGSVYAKVPTECISAERVTTIRHAFDIS